MTDLATILPIILYIFGIILMIVLIIIGLRILQIFDRTEKILDNVEIKLKSLDGLFCVIDKTSSSIDLISTKVVSGIVNLISKLFGKEKNKEANINE